MATARSLILTGPGRVIQAGNSVHSKGDINVTIVKETIPIETAPYGKIDERAVDAMVKVSFTPPCNKAPSAPSR